MKVLAAMGWQTIECFDTIVAEEHLECEYHRTGWLEIYRTQQGRRAGRREAAVLRRFDVEAVELNGDELREQQPAFAEDVIGAMHYRDSAFADPHRFVLELTGRARQHGAELRQNADRRAACRRFSILVYSAVLASSSPGCFP